MFYTLVYLPFCTNVFPDQGLNPKTTNSENQNLFGKKKVSITLILIKYKKIKNKKKMKKLQLKFHRFRG